MVMFLGVIMVCLSEDVPVLGRCMLKFLGMRYHDGWNLLPNDLAKGDCMSIYRARGIRLGKMLTVGKNLGVGYTGVHCTVFSNMPIGLQFFKYKLDFKQSASCLLPSFLLMSILHQARHSATLSSILYSFYL